MFKKQIKITGASRTDSKVHALGQRAAFKVDSTIPVDKIPYALNSKLPDDIVITDAKTVSDNFHPRYDAISKIYEYKIQNAKFKKPMLRNYCEFEKEELDIFSMQECCKYFIGTKDFKSFCASKSSAKTTVRTIFDLKITKVDDIISLTIEGSGFLYNMVRIIAGTIIDVGKGKIKPVDISNIILSKDRNNASKTASACGLTLFKVYY